MKCLCGYYYLKEWEIENEDIVFQEELEKNNGEDEFIQIKGSFHTEQKYSGHLNEVYVFACPKCGTLKI
jgi:hypothetical protein